MENLRQKEEFLKGEGDQWFLRNQNALNQPSALRAAVIRRIAKQLNNQIRHKALEIGCADGSNLAELALLREIEGHGIDPSSKAIEQGIQKYRGLKLVKGTADEPPYESGAFDFILFGFCLYLVDRSLLQQVIAEADRVLRDGGLLGILDFDPPYPVARKYRHRDGLITYKMDYSRLFTANPAYLLVDKLSLSHRLFGWDPDPDERVALVLCRKHLAGAYRSDL